ncbi:hypothetical protein Tco_1043111 [Tanacetum coccineum]|uniref:Uncharacterized protein n=1 Tax=Tanacetum coccineum TaxID=301880 RepID=A0ABQ5GL98_9ASTR
MNSRIRTSMDVIITCQVIDYHFGKPSIRDEERSYFLLWVLQTGFVACFKSFLSRTGRDSIELPPKVDKNYSAVYWRQSSTGRLQEHLMMKSMLRRSWLFLMNEVEREHVVLPSYSAKELLTKTTDIAEKRS